MKIALAQIHPIPGDISANITKHVQYIEKALEVGTQAIFFPELSLSAYEPGLAQELAIGLEDERLAVFQEISDRSSMVIGVGAPMRTEAGILIGMLLFQDSKPRTCYAKQILHEDEYPYFVPGNEQLLLNIGNGCIAPAICYESLQSSHAEQAIQAGANVYLASVAKSQKGVDKAYLHYPAIAQQYGIPVLMVNAVGFCDNFRCAGQSGVWSKNGVLLGQLDEKEEGILIFEGEKEVLKLV